MPRYRSYGDAFTRGYELGYDEGFQEALEKYGMSGPRIVSGQRAPSRARRSGSTRAPRKSRRKPVKLSSWQRYIKNKKNHIKLRSGKLNLKKMAVQFRKTKAGKKKK